MLHVVHVSNHQRRRIDTKQLRRAVRAVLRGEGFKRSKISVAVVDDSTILDINRRFLDHNEPTDVISFLFSSDKAMLEGEIVTSAQTAASAAKHFGWKPADELLLYVIHGALHLTGYDDQSKRARQAMRKRERHYLSHFGLNCKHSTPEP